MVEPGRRTLGDRYELGSLLATGGMGQVWRGRDTLLDRPVAVKVLRNEFTGDPTFLARFRAEARHTAVLAHRNIAALYDYGEETAQDGTGETLAYLVMELVDGESLSDLLARERRLPVGPTLDLLEQTAAGLAAAHAAGVVHRDVKPGNVLVGADGTIKITDFGIAWSASSVPLTQTGQVVGTAHYLSPEQAAGTKAGPASDVYSLGMIGYECLAGRRAFDGDNSVQIALRQLRDTPDPLPDDVPENVRRLIGRALLKDPAQRFPDGAAFRDAVADVLVGRMLTPPPVDTGTRRFAAVAGPPPRRRWLRVLAPVAALLAGAGIAVAGVQLVGSDPPPATAAGPTTVVLVADDYLGRPVGEVEAELGASGFAVERRAEETAARPAGTVTAISPAGAVRVGSTIVVRYAVAPAVAPVSETPAPRPAEVPQSGGGPGTAVSPPVAGNAGEAADDGADEGADEGGADDADDAAPGNGNGKGNGNGNGGGKGNGRGRGDG
ncbi:protein kinase domain-containing protein [Blastococcus haudaquaticus]|uniref:non-specific serine/threonine protein kinase n=1 Tax=Blastococcus haudaquaticus TaxID=1938745 RepID=A0A286GKL1_9ACTN|nr:protein kinase [Blastococcus haudaquaticus]SOD95716.1 serine/threonine protein kinase [Blastococcus haudaquaticus]